MRETKRGGKEKVERKKETEYRKRKRERETKRRTADRGKRWIERRRSEE